MFPENTRILVVDDVSTSLETLGNMVKELGYIDVLTATDGMGAIAELEKARAMGKPVGLVLSDIKMPNMDGLAFLKKLRASREYGNLPIILVTAVGESETILESISQGVNSYIIKPVTIEGLRSKIQAVWGRVKKK